MGDNTKPKKSTRQRTRPYELRPTDIAGYLTQMKKAGRAEATLSKYRNDLELFRDFLGEAAQILPETPARWKQAMIDRDYAPRTVNSRMVALNGFLGYIGCQDWQIFDWMETEAADEAELSREEYRLLLETARQNENIQLYLMVKTLACADLTPGDLQLVTREAVNDGVVQGRMRGAQREVPLPELLRIDLLDFAIHRGIRKGPLFLSSNRKPYGRTTVAHMIADLGIDAGLEPGKATPRSLRRLYQNTLAAFQERADAWVASSYRDLLQTEEDRVGWRVPVAVRRELPTGR